STAARATRAACQRSPAWNGRTEMEGGGSDALTAESSGPAPEGLESCRPNRATWLIRRFLALQDSIEAGGGRWDSGQDDGDAVQHQEATPCRPAAARQPMVDVLT